MPSAEQCTLAPELKFVIIDELGPHRARQQKTPCCEPDCTQSNQEEKRVVSPLPTNAQDSGDLHQVTINVGNFQKGIGVL